MKNIRLFETEQEFLNDPIEREYPTVSYIKDVDSVHYEEKASPCVYLPCIDTTGFATEFIEGEYYPQEAQALKAIHSMYEEHDLNIGIDGRLFKNNIFIADISNEPMYVNWLSKLTIDGESTMDNSLLFGIGTVGFEIYIDQGFYQSTVELYIVYSDNEDFGLVRRASGGIG